MTSEKVESLKNLIYTDIVGDEVEDRIFVMYKQDGGNNGSIPVINMDVKCYVRLDALPEDLEQAVRKHFGIEKGGQKTQ